MATRKQASRSKTPRKAASARAKKAATKKTAVAPQKTARKAPAPGSAAGESGSAKYDQPGAPWWKKFVPTGLR